jgi:hypothetical protein
MTRSTFVEHMFADILRADGPPHVSPA